jgi:hypothetical protein
MGWITVENVIYNSGRHQNLMLNPPVSVVSGVHVAFLGDHVGSRWGWRVNKGALRTLQPQYPKIQSISLMPCNSLPTIYWFKGQFQMPGTYLVLHCPHYQGQLLSLFFAKG